MSDRARVTFPVACIAGEWIHAEDGPRWIQRNPSHWDQVLGEVASAGESVIDRAVCAAATAQTGWQSSRPEHRVACLRAWANLLARQEATLAALMATEVGKPLSEGRLEVRRTVELLRCLTESDHTLGYERIARDLSVRSRPLGVVSALTPWNNPVAIAVGKLGPALFHGNSVVWKPAMQAPRTSQGVLETLLRTGLPNGLVNLVQGNALTAQQLIRHPGIAAVSFTGSVRTGRLVAKECARLLKPLQAEMGGNNATIVMPDVEPEAVARELALAAFSYAGQRCTAGRRLIVHHAILPAFLSAMVAATEHLVLGDPRQEDTEVGPLISRMKQRAMGRLVSVARREGARVLAGGRIPRHRRAGCYYQPTLLLTDVQDSQVIQEETFGPLAVIQPAHDMEDALALANGVRQGLVMSLYSRDERCIRHFLAEAQAGNLKINSPTIGVDVRAPFTGWKASGLGPGEHGRADARFYTHDQTIYGQDTGLRE